MLDALVWGSHKEPEVIMFRKLATVVVLGAISLSGLLAAGCASSPSNAPYSLTGSSAEQQRKERLRYTDDKGRYHPELQSAGIALHSYP